MPFEHDTATRSEVLAARGVDGRPANGARSCERCDGPLDDDASPRARVCRRCTAARKSQNDRARKAARKEATDAAPQPPPTAPPVRSAQAPRPVEDLAGELTAEVVARAREQLGLD